MITTGEGQVTEPAVWSLVPEPVSTGWSGDLADALGSAGCYELQPGAREEVAARLAVAAQEEPLPGLGTRLVFAPRPREGAVLFSVGTAAVTGPSVETQRELLGLDGLGEFVGQLDDLRDVGIEGYQLLRVDRAAVDIGVPEGDGAAVPVATLVTVLRRSMPGMGLVDVVAAARSTDVVTVAAAVLPVVQLLLSEDLQHSSGGDR